MTSTPHPRAGWFADVHNVLAAAQANPALPLPAISAWRATFYLTDSSPRGLAAAEAALADALGVTFAGYAEDEPPQYYVLEADLPGGLKVRIKAWRDDVADRKVTGQTVTEVVEWVRKPVPEPGPDDDDGTEGGNR